LDLLENLVNEIKAGDVKAKAFHRDVSDEKSIEACAQQIRRFELP
jgi:hypothetical protein